MNKFRGLVAILLAVLIIFSLNRTYVTYGMTSYSNNDILGHWAEKQMMQWCDYGIVAGYSDGSLKPNEKITRAEFATMLNRMCGFTKKADNNFADISADNWYYEQILLGKEAGYFDGTEDSANPEDLLTREQAVMMLQKVFQLEENKESKSKRAATYDDYDLISPYAIESMEIFVHEGIVHGYKDNTLKPQNNITRAEAVTMMNNLVQTIYHKAGVYESEEFQQSVLINTSNVTLKNMTMRNLYLTDGIGDGEAKLQNVNITGRAYITGGGLNSICFEDTNVNKCLVNKKDGNLRLVIKGDFDTLIISSPAIIVLEKGSAINKVIIEKNGKGTEIIGDGKIKNLSVNADFVKVNGKSVSKEVKKSVNDAGSHYDHNNHNDNNSNSSNKAKQPPNIYRDDTNNVIGENIDIAFDDHAKDLEDWKQSINRVKITNNPVNGYTIGKDTITLPWSIFPEAPNEYHYKYRVDNKSVTEYVYGEYNISIEARNYQPRSVCQAVYEDTSSVSINNLKIAQYSGSNYDDINHLTLSLDGELSAKQLYTKMKFNNGREAVLKEGVPYSPDCGEDYNIYFAEGANISWTSNNSNIVTVSNTGKMKAVGFGSAVVSAQFGAYTANIGVEVIPPDFPAGSGMWGNMKIKLNIINKSNDRNNSDIVIFQKPTNPDWAMDVIAWRVIKNCGQGVNYPFEYDYNLQINTTDMYGNPTPLLDAKPGDVLQMIRNDSGDVLEFIEGRNSNSDEIQVINHLLADSIDAYCYRSRKPLAKKSNIVPEECAFFEFNPILYIAMMPNGAINEGDVINPAILKQMNAKELSILGLRSANIVIRGGGIGDTYKPYTFTLDNVIFQ